jgi:medium-chain acyl-[acyl-carrier-protein] hydrolase
MITFNAADRRLASVGPGSPSRADIRLFCFPYAGGGTSVFQGWAETIPRSVKVCPVQLPGREKRFREPALTHLPALVEDLAESLLPYLTPPFAFFGHSLGALLAFELARWVRRQHGPQPVHLFVSGCGAPQCRTAGGEIHALSPAEFREELRRLNGTPAAVLDDDELMDLLLPTLRADFALAETYAYADGPPLASPITALGGLSDVTVGVSDLDAWRVHTTGRFRRRLLPGDHFFLQTARPLLLWTIARELLPSTMVPPQADPWFTWPVTSASAPPLATAGGEARR